MKKKRIGRAIILDLVRRAEKYQIQILINSISSIREIIQVNIMGAK
jgi:hypothetical protein